MQLPLQLTSHRQRPSGKPSVTTVVLFEGKKPKTTKLYTKDGCTSYSPEEGFKITAVQSPLCAAPATGPKSGPWG